MKQSAKFIKIKILKFKKRKLYELVNQNNYSCYSMSKLLSSTKAKNK